MAQKKIILDDDGNVISTTYAVTQGSNEDDSNDRVYSLLDGSNVSERNLQPGMRIDLNALYGNIGNGPSPDPTKDLRTYLGERGLSFEQYLNNFQAQPWRIENGVAVYDPSAQVNNFSYAPANTAFENLLTAAPLALAGYGLLQGGGLGDLFGGIEGGSGFGEAEAILDVAGGAEGGAAPFTGSMDAGFGLEGLLDYVSPDALTLPAGAATSALGQLGNIGDPTIDANAPSVDAGLSGTGATGAAPAGSALSRILSGNATDADWLSLAGKLGSAALGIYGSGQQNDAFSSLANKYLDLGAPARARLEASYADPNSFLSGPDVTAITQRGADAAARALSSRVGNPALNPGAWAELMDYTTKGQWGQLSNYRNQLAAQGGLGVAPAASFDANSVGNRAAPYRIGGALLGDLTSPQKTVLQQMQELAALSGGRNPFAGMFSLA